MQSFFLARVGGWCNKRLMWYLQEVFYNSSNQCFKNIPICWFVFKKNIFQWIWFLIKKQNIFQIQLSLKNMNIEIDVLQSLRRGGPLSILFYPRWFAGFANFKNHGLDSHVFSARRTAATQDFGWIWRWSFWKWNVKLVNQWVGLVLERMLLQELFF